MIKNYTNKDYSDKAIEANSKGQSLYILLSPTEFEKDVLDFTTEIVKQPIYNENGEEIGTKDVEIQVAVIIDKEIPIYDDEGNQTGTEIIRVQSSHKEKYTKDVATLIIAEPNYYICTEDNYTYGEINENFELEQAEKEAEHLAMLSLTRGDVFRALLLAKGVTREQLRSQLEVMPASSQEEIVKRELALIDFDEALDFYRGNPLIDTVGLALGLTKEQLDRFFETNDYKELITANPQD